MVRRASTIISRRRCARSSARGANSVRPVPGVGQPLSVRARLRADGRRTRQGRRGEPRQGDSAAHLTPIPRGESLEAISQALLADLDAAFAARRNAVGEAPASCGRKNASSCCRCRPTSFEVRKPIPVEISSRAMVKVEGAWYSVPSRWARLNATAYLGVDDVRITCMDESVTHPRARFGTRQVRYRHYLARAGAQAAGRAPGGAGVDRRTGRAVERILAAVVRHPRRTGSRASVSAAARRGLRARRRSRAPGAGGGA